MQTMSEWITKMHQEDDEDVIEKEASELGPSTNNELFDSSETGTAAKPSSMTFPAEDQRVTDFGSRAQIARLEDEVTTVRTNG